MHTLQRRSPFSDIRKKILSHVCVRRRRKTGVKWRHLTWLWFCFAPLLLQGTEMLSYTVRFLNILSQYTAFVQTTTITMNKNNNDSYFLCYKCGKQSTNYSSYQSFVGHTCLGDPSICDVCNHSFTSKRALKVHQKSVHQKKKFSCDNCKLECATLSSLLRHEKIHKKSVLHSCESCDKKFSRADALKAHQFNCTVKEFKSTCKEWQLLLTAESHNHVRSY